jgi:hypothetical protein
MVDDLRFETTIDTQELVRVIAGQIRTQCASHVPTLFSEFVPRPARSKHRPNRRGINQGERKRHNSDEQEEESNEEEEVDMWNDSGICIIVRIEFNVGGNLNYKDQFEYHLFPLSKSIDGRCMHRVSLPQRHFQDRLSLNSAWYFAY